MSEDGRVTNPSPEAEEIVEAMARAVEPAAFFDPTPEQLRSDDYALTNRDFRIAAAKRRAAAHLSALCEKLGVGSVENLAGGHFMSAQDVSDLDDVVRELGLESSHVTPAEEVRSLRGQIEALQKHLTEALEDGDAELSALRSEVARLREALRPFAELCEDVSENREDHDFYAGGPITVGALRRARAALESPHG